MVKIVNYHFDIYIRRLVYNRLIKSSTVNLENIKFKPKIEKNNENNKISSNREQELRKQLAEIRKQMDGTDRYTFNELKIRERQILNALAEFDYRIVY